MSANASSSVTAADAYERLRADIVAGRLQPNERLVEADLTKSLGTTRTAVRGALARLAHEGLVEHERNRGAKVRLVGEAEAIEILEARAVLEGLVARKAAANATEADVADLRAVLASMRELLDTGDLLGVSELNSKLHQTMLRIAGHRTAEGLVSMLNPHIVRFQFRTILQPGRPAKSFAEHSAIVDAIAAGDGDGAEAAMRRHLSHVADALRASAHAGP
ncbi:MAG TPA: GntR family transcriptional regulator [Gaiellaceae bacterium]|nr:GntR family transcriptional regulator [Gaiellaceae bacterium]